MTELLILGRSGSLRRERTGYKCKRYKGDGAACTPLTPEKERLIELYTGRAKRREPLFQAKDGRADEGF